MQIVIDIDNEDFEEITEHYSYELGHDFSDRVFMKIENGTPLEEVLRDIKEEMDKERVGYPPSAGYYKAITKCLQIIDKYKAKKEE